MANPQQQIKETEAQENVLLNEKIELLDANKAAKAKKAAAPKKTAK